MWEPLILASWSEIQVAQDLQLESEVGAACGPGPVGSVLPPCGQRQNGIALLNTQLMSELEKWSQEEKKNAKIDE